MTSLCMALGTVAAQPAFAYDVEQENKSFLKFYGGYNLLGGADLRLSGSGSALPVPLTGVEKFETSVGEVSMKDSSMVGFVIGYWIKTFPRWWFPLSFGVSSGFDYTRTSYSGLIKRNVVFNDSVNPGITETRTLVKNGAKIDYFDWQIINFLVGHPWRNYRFYAGLGVNIVHFHYVTPVISAGGDVANTGTDDAAKLTYNFRFGVDYYITEYLSVFTEGRFIPLPKLKFTPEGVGDVPGTTTIVNGEEVGDKIISGVTDELEGSNSIRFAAGVTYHFW